MEKIMRLDIPTGDGLDTDKVDITIGDDTVRFELHDELYFEIGRDDLVEALQELGVKT